MTTQEIQAKQKQEIKEHEQTHPGRYFVPEVDIFEDEDGLCVWADVPGVEPDGVNVEVEDDVLTLEGKVSLADYEGLTPVRTEYNVGPYLRRFSLPRAHRYDRERIAARLRDGVLEIRIPRAEEAKPRRIDISAE
jgi:HSP20 family molecular chaperone IbpA